MHALYIKMSTQQVAVLARYSMHVVPCIMHVATSTLLHTCCFAFAVICQNNDTVKTISCTFNTTYYALLEWTPSTLNRTRVDLGSDVSVLTFNYSSLPSGYHQFDISYNYSLESPFAKLYCHCPFCSCRYSTTLEVEGLFVCIVCVHEVNMGEGLKFIY